MTRRVLAAAMVLPLLAAGCVEQKIAQGQLNSALINAGLSLATSQCISQRIIGRLTSRQLRKLAALGGPRRSADEYIAAVQRINDPQVTQVILSSAALCVTGLDH